MSNGMRRRSATEEEGQALAEFGVALLVLVPLLFWILRFADLLTEKHRVIEMSRSAVWEMANGGEVSDVESRIRSTLSESSLFSSGSDISVDVNIGIQSTEDDLKTLSRSYPLYFIGTGNPMATDFGLNFNNRYTCGITVRDRLFGLPVSVSGRCGLIGDSWHLIDAGWFGGNGKIDNDDLEFAVYGVWLWPLNSPTLRALLDVNHAIQESDFMKVLSRWPFDMYSTFDLDIEPRGHPKLEFVPRPSP
jgi:hypothetical protein